MNLDKDTLMHFARLADNGNKYANNVMIEANRQLDTDEKYNEAGTWKEFINSVFAPPPTKTDKIEELITDIHNDLAMTQRRLLVFSERLEEIQEE